ncbi:MAG TPA: hypothetical protein VL354_00025, partial [Spirochaetia bacterium]|nr:hypothetical protein [Spirochaetia bacterium]
MLERETETILETLRTRTIGDREEILLREVLRCEIPRGIKAYLYAETVRALSQELFALPRFSRIERESSGNWRLARSFLTSMAEGYRFTGGEFLTLLENAVHFLENYLCRPQWTIESFVFEGVTQVGVVELLDKLESIVDYGYFRSLITRVVQHRQTKELGVEEFRSMLMTIDDQIVKQHNARELALLAKPIFDFLLLRDTPPDVEIPIKPVLVFFEDKKMKILREYIESICRIRERSTITLDELTALVEDLYLGHSENAPAEPSKETVERQSPAEGPLEAPAELSRLDPTWVAQEPPLAAAESSEDSLPSTEAQTLPEEEEHTERLPAGGQIEASPDQHEVVQADSTGATAQDATIEPTPAEEVPREEPSPQITTLHTPPPGPRKEPPAYPESPSIFDYVTEEPDGLDDSADEDFPRRAASEGQPLRDLHEFIKGHFRNRFIRRLFHRDEEHYENVIAALNDAPTWKEAS